METAGLRVGQCLTAGACGPLKQVFFRADDIDKLLRIFLVLLAKCCTYKLYHRGLPGAPGTRNTDRGWPSGRLRDDLCESIGNTREVQEVLFSFVISPHFRAIPN